MRQVEAKEYVTDSIVEILDSLAEFLPETAREETKTIARWTRLGNIVFSLEIYFYGIFLDGNIFFSYEKSVRLT